MLFCTVSRNNARLLDNGNGHSYNVVAMRNTAFRHQDKAKTMEEAMTESNPNNTGQRIPDSALDWKAAAVYDEHGGDCHATRQPRHEGHTRKSQKKKRAAHNAQAQSHTI